MIFESSLNHTRLPVRTCHSDAIGRSLRMHAKHENGGLLLSS